ncbi:MAG: GHKL domain-containing protein [Bacteriovoracaceae bacterium]|nr:GHKL domain-containing protein [Bacteriovoracaceae bacterium]
MKLNSFDSIFKIGIDHVISVREKHRIRYVNRVLFFGICSTIIFSGINFHFGLEKATVVLLSIIPFYFFSFYLNSKGRNVLSPVLSIFVATTAISAIAYDIKADIGIQYILFSITGLPALCLPKENKVTMLSLIIYIFIMAGIILTLNFNNEAKTLISPENVTYLYFLNFFQASSLFIFKITVTLQEMDNRYDAYLENHSKLENQTRMSDLGRLTAGIAHEINNPLTVIKGASSFCLKRIEGGNLETPRLKTELKRMSKHVERVVKIIEGLRFVSRDGSKDNFESKSIGAVIKDAYELCSYKLNGEGVNSSFVPLFSETKCSIRVVQIEQVIFSLISNAIDALENQSEKNITVLMSESNRDVFIRVRDNGPGIPNEIKGEVLKPFFTTKPVGEGTGLGLSVAAEIIKNHNGQLSIEESLEGASFLIRLPKEQSLKAA